MKLTFDVLRLANHTRQQEWDKEGRINASYRAMELGGEVGEALNVVKKLERERLGIRGSRATPEQLAEELADVVICADLIAMHYGIELGEAVATKFNATSEKVGLSTRIPTAASDEEPTQPEARPLGAGCAAGEHQPLPGSPDRCALGEHPSTPGLGIVDEADRATADNAGTVVPPEAIPERPVYVSFDVSDVEVQYAGDPSRSE